MGPLLHHYTVRPGRLDALTLHHLDQRQVAGLRQALGRRFHVLGLQLDAKALDQPVHEVEQGRDSDQMVERRTYPAYERQKFGESIIVTFFALFLHPYFFVGFWLLCMIGLFHLAPIIGLSTTWGYCPKLVLCSAATLAAKENITSNTVHYENIHGAVNHQRSCKNSEHPDSMRRDIAALRCAVRAP